MKRRMWVGIGIEIVGKIRVAKKSYARGPKSKWIRTFGLGFGIEEATGIEIGAAMGD